MDDKIEILLNEYKLCNEAYNNRDDIIFHEFNVIVAFIAALFVIINYLPTIFSSALSNKDAF
ncbi:MAG TPA: hypothetical protein VMS89_06975, partial [Methanoregulaceae archaeon]|nr:hypothetical protein [Methanoregulaceae archaeon]